MKRFWLWQFAGAVLALSLIVGLTPVVAKGSRKGNDTMSVSDGKTVSIEYTLKLEDQSVVESNVGAEPLTYTQGTHHIIPGLENALAGMKVGENKEVTIAPDEAYGHVNDAAFKEVGKDQIPPDAMKVGTMLQGQDPNGSTFTVRISEIKDESVVLDFNHPLAGKTLVFDVKVLNIQ
jgi:FKBP-type peptidyl-prolyl cis-trans isomerase SlyD